MKSIRFIVNKIFVTALILFIFPGCDSTKKPRSAIVIGDGINLTRLIDNYKDTYGYYPESISDVIKEYKGEFTKNLDTNLWGYFSHNGCYFIIHKRITNGEIYVFSSSGENDSFRVQ